MRSPLGHQLSALFATPARRALERVLLALVVALPCAAQAQDDPRRRARRRLRHARRWRHRRSGVGLPSDPGALPHLRERARRARGCGRGGVFRGDWNLPSRGTPRWLRVEVDGGTVSSPSSTRAATAAPRRRRRACACWPPRVRRSAGRVGRSPPAPDGLVPGDTGMASDAADDAARALHRLHAAGERPFGLASDARIGGLHQPNAPEDSWLVFFAGIASWPSPAPRARRGPARRPRGRARRARRGAARRPRGRASVPGAPPRRPLGRQRPHRWRGPHRVPRSRPVSRPPRRSTSPSRPCSAASRGASSTPIGKSRRTRSRRSSTAASRSERKDLWNLFPLLVHVRLFGGATRTSSCAPRGRFA